MVGLRHLRVVIGGATHQDRQSPRRAKYAGIMSAATTTAISGMPTRIALSNSQLMDGGITIVPFVDPLICTVTKEAAVPPAEGWFAYA